MIARKGYIDKQKRNLKKRVISTIYHRIRPPDQRHIQEILEEFRKRYTVDISIMHTVRRRQILCIIMQIYWIWDALYDKAKGRPRQRPTLCIT